VGIPRIRGWLQVGKICEFPCLLHPSVSSTTLTTSKPHDSNLRGPKKLVLFKKFCRSGKEESRTGGSNVDTGHRRGIEEHHGNDSLDHSWLMELMPRNVLRCMLRQIGAAKLQTELNPWSERPGPQAAGLPRQDHVLITTNEFVRFDNNKFDEILSTDSKVRSEVPYSTNQWQSTNIALQGLCMIRD